MAKIKRQVIKKLRNKEIKKPLWLENKIERARSRLKPYAARASRFGAPAGVALLVLITLYSLFSHKDRFEQARERVLRNTNDFEAHLVLAEEFLKNNQIAEAEKELLLVQQIQSNNQQYSLVKPDPALQDNIAINQAKVLGLTSKLEELWQRWREENPEEIKKEIQKWERFVSENPTYRDGWLQLALLYFKLDEKDKARESSEKALELDPNYESARKIESIMK